MKISFGKKLASMLLAIVMLTCLGVTAFASSEEPSAEPAVVEDAILYQIADGVLEYNVTHSAPLAESVAVSGAGVTSLGMLQYELGVADEPARVLGTDPGSRTLGLAVTANLTLDADGAVAAIEVTDISERPVIGISWKRITIGDDYMRFANAFERGGALAVFLPQLNSESDAQTVLAAVDGIFVTGGEDWNPSLYGETQTPHGSSYWNDARDTSDIYLMQQAIALDVPMLCVCRGEQGLNVALGGALIQDIPYYLGQKVLAGEIDVSRVTGVLSGTLPGSDETVEDTGYAYFDDTYEFVARTYDEETGEYLEGLGCDEGHLRVQVDGVIHSGGDGYHVLEAGSDGIGVSKDSKWLYDILGSEYVDLVATAHHQAADPERLGEGLTVVAMSSDGIVEGVEYQANTFALAIQWHPERDALEDTRGVDVDQDVCNALLGALIDYAAQAHAAAEVLPAA